MASLGSIIKNKLTSSNKDKEIDEYRQAREAQIKDFNANIYYSQEGEDIILERIFSGQAKGFFVDIGAHHPTRFSNTYNSYLKGWRGINVDATPGSMEPFKMVRPEDINLEMGIAASEGSIEYYIMDEPALNTFSKERMEHLVNDTPYNLSRSVVVKTSTLSKVLAQYLPENQSIDFLTIDVEGLDFEILESNDWQKYRPYIILTEEWSSSLEDVYGSRLYKLLHPLGYELYAKTVSTFFFRDSLRSDA